MKPTSSRNFHALLQTRFAQGFRVCVGLDPELGKIPQSLNAVTVKGRLVEFCTKIIEATAPYAAAFKPNSAFFEAHGPAGIEALKLVIGYAKHVAPHIPVILDAKRGDIGNTNDGYVTSAFEDLGADAITVAPYMGSESLQPFLNRIEKGIIILCRTSNPGAAEFQDLWTTITSEQSRQWGLGHAREVRFYQRIALQVKHSWNRNRNCLLVVGATAPAELAEVRKLVGPEMTILIPGVGAQGAKVEDVVPVAGRNFLVNSSRSIIFASAGTDFEAAAATEAKRLHEEIAKYLK
ncbi:MAG: pyrF [Candidatus Taylorbacteria bacterium]|nr:pyrF [Candidatus Taylorbacteria bacterium]